MGLIPIRIRFVVVVVFNEKNCDKCKYAAFVCDDNIKMQFKTKTPWSFCHIIYGNSTNKTNNDTWNSNRIINQRDFVLKRFFSPNILHFILCMSLKLVLNFWIGRIYKVHLINIISELEVSSILFVANFRIKCFLHSWVQTSAF